MMLSHDGDLQGSHKIQHQLDVMGLQWKTLGCNSSSDNSLPFSGCALTGLKTANVTLRVPVHVSVPESEK